MTDWVATRQQTERAYLEWWGKPAPSAGGCGGYTWEVLAHERTCRGCEQPIPVGAYAITNGTVHEVKPNTYAHSQWHVRCFDWLSQSGLYSHDRPGTFDRPWLKQPNKAKALHKAFCTPAFKLDLSPLAERLALDEKEKAMGYTVHTETWLAKEFKSKPYAAALCELAALFSDDLAAA